MCGGMVRGRQEEKGFAVENKNKSVTNFCMQFTTDHQKYSIATKHHKPSAKRYSRELVVEGVGVGDEHALLALLGLLGPLLLHLLAARTSFLSLEGAHLVLA